MTILELQEKTRLARGQCPRCGNAEGVRTDGRCAACIRKLKTPLSVLYKNKGGMFTQNVKHTVGHDKPWVDVAISTADILKGRMAKA